MKARFQNEKIGLFREGCNAEIIKMRNSFSQLIIKLVLMDAEYGNRLQYVEDKKNDFAWCNLIGLEGGLSSQTWVPSIANEWRLTTGRCKM